MLGNLPTRIDVYPYGIYRHTIVDGVVCSGVMHEETLAGPDGWRRHLVTAIWRGSDSSVAEGKWRAFEEKHRPMRRKENAMRTINIPPGFHPVRHDRLIQEQIHDTYKAKGKLPEPTVCPKCQAVFHEGRWQWGKTPDNAHSEICPACRRVSDHCPAGYVNLAGAFFSQHRSEILSLVHNQEQRARLEHPLQRIMHVEAENGSVLITTSDIHLARAIGEAIHNAYQGQLEFHYNPDDIVLRVHWRR